MLYLIKEKKMAIVQEYFGQPIKLSTAVESQQDLVESVIQENPDQVYPKNTRYTVKLTNGDTYNVYVK